MGLRTRLTTTTETGQTLRFAALRYELQRELRRILAELEEFQYIPRIWLDRSEEVASTGGYGSGRGARTNGKGYARKPITSDKPFLDCTPGAPVYHEIMDGKSGTRGAVIAALRRYMAGRAATTLTTRAVDVAVSRARGRAKYQPLLPIEAGETESVRRYRALGRKGWNTRLLKAEMAAEREAILES